jgi:cytochrome c biogenesis protein
MQQSAVMAAPLARVASTRLTRVLLALLAAAIIVGSRNEALAPVLLALALAALALNFVAAIIARPIFRRQAPLLVVHLALFAVVVLVGLGQLTRLSGRFELTQGVPFDGTLMDRDAGPWHRSQLDRVVFRHDGFEIEYAPGLKRGRTRNAVQWLDELGGVQRAVIGDHEPLVLRGYRFTTTPNKGFAPVFTWQANRSREIVQGAVHLPSYPAHQLRQARAWALPDGGEIWIKLASEEMLIDPDRPGAFQLPRVKDVIVRMDEARAEMRVGDTVELPGGRLHYAGLRTWMGYRVFHDWTLPWLLVASTLAALALGLHFWLRFRGEPWDVPAPTAAMDS